MSGESARTTEVMEAERNCSAETNAGTGKWWRQSLLMSSSEEEASENMSIAHAASLLYDCSAPPMSAGALDQN